MAKSKKTKKVKVVPRTDANQGVRERIERLHKQRDWQQKKIEEIRQKMEESRKLHEEAEKVKSSGIAVTGETVAPQLVDAEKIEPLNLSGAYNKKNDEE